MNRHYDRYLVNKFPGLYKDRGQGVRATSMCWGFQHGDGWFYILHNLSTVLEPLGVVASTVKEKYGTLRFYIWSYPLGARGKLVDKAIEHAEWLSRYTCESCGNPGKLYDKGWSMVRCTSCYQKL